MARLSGRWPLAVFGAGTLPRNLDCCPLCSASQADICHLLLVCPGTTAAREDWSSTALPGGTSVSHLTWERFRWELFSFPSASDTLHMVAAHIKFVGSACEAAAKAMLEQLDNDSIRDFILEAEASITHDLGAQAT